MAVVYEKYAPGLIRAYSDKGLYIKNPDGEVYYEAVDPDWTHRTYYRKYNLYREIPGYESFDNSVPGAHVNRIRGVTKYEFK